MTTDLGPVPIPPVFATMTWYEVYAKIAGRWCPFDEHHYSTIAEAKEHAWTGEDCRIMQVTKTVRPTA